MRKYLILISMIVGLALPTTRLLAQSMFPDSIGQRMQYNASIETKRGYLSGICFMANYGDEIKATIFNEFGITALDFSYEFKKKKIILFTVISFLDKWYIKRVLKKDLVQLLNNLQTGIGEYNDEKYGILYKFNVLNYEIEG